MLLVFSFWHWGSFWHLETISLFVLAYVATELKNSDNQGHKGPQEALPSKCAGLKHVDTIRFDYRQGEEDWL